MNFAKQPDIPLVMCDTCRGTGHRGLRTCRTCRGMSAGRSIRGRFLYWGQPLTHYHIGLRRARRMLHRFELFGALIFGLGFLTLFFFEVTERAQIDDLLTAAFWTGSGDVFRVLFWLSVVSFSFLVYRIFASKHVPVAVEQREYGTDKSPADERMVAEDWKRIVRLSRAKRFDIAKTFTDSTKKILEAAYIVAEHMGAETIRPGHVFYALLSSTTIQNLCIRLGIPPKKLQALIAKKSATSKQKTIPRMGEDILQIVFAAYEIARDNRQDVVEETELLLATVRRSKWIQELLYDLNVDAQKLDNMVEWLRIRSRLRRQYQRFRKAAARRSKYGLDRAMTAVATPYLNSFSQDITLAAKFGRLSPCVAREKEIQEIFQIIEGGRQSVLLVGDRGVGKMSIIEGIAERMVEEEVPEALLDKRLVQLSASALLAGTTVAGAQERLINMMREIQKAGNVVLFIRNIDDLISVGSQGAGIDVSETLAEFLGPGRFLTLATTTNEGYNRSVTNTELGKALARVSIPEMDANQAIQVLESKAGSLEYKHRIFFTYDALEQSVALAGKFLHDQRLPESAVAIATEAASAVKNKKGEHALVEGDDVAAIVSGKTGIPTTTISEEESKKLLRLEEEMHRRIIGQDEAVMLVASALRRARAEIRSEDRPIANFLFLGPTGVGKTELAKTIADVYFGSEDRMIRIDMSEYQDKSGIYRLIGEPNKQGTGILTEAVRQNPFSLILLDEMEKADPDVLNLFLQVFDDGRLTDSVGRVIDFTNTIIIATSNAGTNYVQKQIDKGVDIAAIREHLIRGELKKYYRPEFLNRFDGIVLFRALKQDEIKQIAGLMLNGVRKDLQKRGVELRVEDAALEALATAGFDPEFGARPMRRAIQNMVENKLAELVLQKKLKRRDTVVLGQHAEIRVES